jgi:hypothetical protein
MNETIIEIKDVKVAAVDGIFILETTEGEHYKIVIVKTDGVARMELVYLNR